VIFRKKFRLQWERHPRGGGHCPLNAEIARIMARLEELRTQTEVIVADLEGPYNGIGK